MRWFSLQLPPTTLDAPAASPPAATTTSTTPAASPSPSDNASDVSADSEQLVKAKGGFALPIKDRFLERMHLFELLRLERETTEGIPEGVKENEFYLVNNAANLERRKNNKYSLFADDCGAWKGGPTNLALFVYDDDGILIQVTMKDSLYGTRCAKRVPGGRQMVFTPLSRQPLPHEVIRLHRAYAKHSLNKDYQRRITWMDDNTTAIVEYVGTFPRLGPHGGDLSQRWRQTNPVTDHNETSEEVRV